MPKSASLPLCPFLVPLFRNIEDELPGWILEKTIPEYILLLLSCGEWNCGKWNIARWEPESMQASSKCQRSNCGKAPKPAKAIYAFLVENWEQGGGSWITTPTIALGPVDSTGFIQFCLLYGLLETSLLDSKCRMLTLLAPSVPFWM